MSGILAAIDFSSQSQEVITQALEQAKVSNTKLWIVHVAAPNPDFVGMEVGPVSVRDNRAKELSNEHKTLGDFKILAEKDGVETDALLIQGPTVKTIIEEAEKLACHMIVVGSHGHGALYDLLVGSTAEALIRKSKVPCLVVPAKN